MAQFGRPIADQLPTGIVTPWADQPWWSKLDESSPSDADYIESDDIAGETMIVQLSPMLPPGVNTGHIVRVRTSKASGSTNGNMWIQDAAGGVFAQYTVDGLNYVSGGFTTTTWNVDAADIAGIADSDYLNLYLRVQTYGNGARVSWIEMETPDVSPIDVSLSDALTFDIDPAPAKTVQPSLSDALGFSMLAPGLNDPERLIDAGRLFRVTRTRLAPKERSAFVDFEDV